MSFDLARLGEGLAARSLIDALPPALRSSRTAVVHAPAGAGKTTLVPPLLATLSAEQGRFGRIVVTAPRRVAARAAARRLAALTGTRIGDLVGYAVRGDRRAGPRTRVEFVTDGLFVRRLLADPELGGVAAVVLDEVHERTLDGDLAIALTRDVAELRDDLVLVAMSATLDTDRWAQLLGVPGTSGQAAPVVGVDLEPHPLEVEWSPPPPRVTRLDARGVTPAFLDHVARVTAQHSSRAEGSVLVFVPGAWEIDRVVTAVRTLAPTGPDGRGFDVLPLHGRLTPAAQDAALNEGPRPRIVVATDVAESSLTVAGVHLVVDAGLAREPRPDVARGTGRLVTVPVSRASATQRAGRAARLGPGRVVRCWPAGEWDRMRPDRTPQIVTADLTSAALTMACWGAPEGAGLALPQPPPPAALAVALRELTELGALDADGRATAEGKALAAIPAEPRQARALLTATELTGADPRTAEAVAVLTIDERAPGADLTALWRRLRADRGPAGTAWQQEVDRLSRFTRADRAEQDLRRLPDDELLALVVALAHPGRIARQRTSDGPDYLLADGHGAALPKDSPLTGQPWLAVADLGGTSGAASLIRAAAPLTRDLAERAGRQLLTSRREAVWDGRRVRGRTVDALGAIALTVRPGELRPEDARPAVAQALADRGLDLFVWSERARLLRRRLALLHRTHGVPWPDVSTAALLADPVDWLDHELDALARGADPARASMTRALQHLLPWPQASQLDRLAPERLEVPSGRQIRLSYPDPDDADGRVVLAVKLQECFGLRAAPTVADGRETVQVHLLSPAGRPLAVTEDLEFFWREAYPQVRAQMRGRYPRHPWPQDPLGPAN